MAKRRRRRKGTRSRTARKGGRLSNGRFRKGYHMTKSGRYVKGTKRKPRKTRRRRRRYHDRETPP